MRGRARSTQAIERLKHAAEIPSDVSYGQLRLHPFWNSLRGDPRFEEIVSSSASQREVNPLKILSIRSRRRYLDERSGFSTMPQAELTLSRRSFGQTTRPDRVVGAANAVFLGFSAFIIYSTWAAFQGESLFRPAPFAVLFAGNLRRIAACLVWPNQPGGRRGWPFRPPLLIWAPAGFRFTCYYYRGAYYKAFWADPGLRRRRAAQHFPRRTLVPAHHPKCAPLFSVSRGAFHSLACARCVESDVVHRSGDGKNGFRNGCRHARAGVNVVLLAVTLSVVTRCAISSAVFSISFQNRPPAIALIPASVVLIAGICSGLG